MTINSSASPSRSELGSEFSCLVSRYPFLTQTEIDRLVTIYPRLLVLDVAVMMSDYHLAPMLDDFFRENRVRLKRTSDLGLAVVALGAVIIVTLAGLLA